MKNFLEILVILFVTFLCISTVYGGIKSDRERGVPSNPTAEPGYSGSCHHWSLASRYIGRETCIWGYPTSAVPGSWVWLHFSEKQNPYPDFAADIDDFFGSTMKFTANNIENKYVGRCVEVYGFLVVEPNTYNNVTAQQPVIHVSSASDIKFCN